MGNSVKRLSEQTRELRKLVVDAQVKLDQAVRGLESLEERLAELEASGLGLPDSNPSS